MESNDEATQQEAKHVGINRAIMEIDAVNRQLDDLAIIISGSDKPSEKEALVAATTTPSLLDFLNCSEETICRKCATAHEKIEEIRRMLLFK